MKKPPVTEAQWARAGEALQGAPMTRERVAGMLGVHISSVHARAAQEGWRMIDFRRQDVLELYREAARLSAEYAAGDGAEDDEPVPGEWGFPGPHDRAGGGAAGGDGADPPAASDWEEIDPVEMLARASRFMARQVGRLVERADRRGGKIDKKDIDALISMQRMMEGLAALAREQAEKDNKKSDEELAEVFEKLSLRIVDLAEQEAGRLAEENEAARMAGAVHPQGAAGPA